MNFVNSYSPKTSGNVPNGERIPVAGGDTSTPLNMTKRLKYIASHLPPGTARVLDCGCGEGAYVRGLRTQYHYDATGIEFQDEKISVARSDPALAPFIRKGDAQALEFPDSTFDAVVLNEVLEHVPDDRAALIEVRRVVREHGVVIVFSPNRWYPFETHGVFLKGSGTRIPPYVPLIPYLPTSVGKRFFRYWARNYGQTELRKLCVAAGFSRLHTDFMWQTFENISGAQPGIIRSARTVLRRIANTCERIPLIRRFGVSQILVLRP